MSRNTISRFSDFVMMILNGNLTSMELSRPERSRSPKQWLFIASILSIILIPWIPYRAYSQNPVQNYTIGKSACSANLANGVNCGDCTTGSIPDPRNPPKCSPLRICAAVQCSNNPIAQACTCQYSGTTGTSCNQTSKTINVSCSNCNYWFSGTPCASKNGNCSASIVPDCMGKGSLSLPVVNAAYLCTPCN